MFQTYENNIVKKSLNQVEKENYIANMLVRTLYSNDVSNAECFRIIKLFKDKILGDIVIE